LVRASQALGFGLGGALVGGCCGYAALHRWAEQPRVSWRELGLGAAGGAYVAGAAAALASLRKLQQLQPELHASPHRATTLLSRAGGRIGIRAAALILGTALAVLPLGFVAVAPDDLEGILAARGGSVAQRLAAVAMLLPAVLAVGLPLAVFVFPPFALAGWAGGRLVGLAVRALACHPCPGTGGAAVQLTSPKSRVFAGGAACS
jgi:hypothetical protein